jgi:catechol 2,3-dioxygenase-like lactoylglutathione lyase family enzyme
MGVRHIAMVTVQVRDFDGMVAWYRDVLGLGIGWLEAGEFCTLTMPGGEAVLRWQPTIPTGSAIVRARGGHRVSRLTTSTTWWAVFVTRACSLMPRRRAQTRDTGWCAYVTPRQSHRADGLTQPARGAAGVRKPRPRALSGTQAAGRCGAARPGPAHSRLATVPLMIVR